jgi:hypothetical protein
MSNTLIALVLIQLTAANNQAALQRGVQEYTSGQYAKAVSSLSLAVKSDPHDDLAHYHLANAYLKTGRKADAIKEYQQAYSMASSQQMAMNCKSVLDLYKAPLPDILTRNSHSTHAVTELSPYTTKSIDQLNALAAKRNKGQSLESHPGGPEVFKESPENIGALKDDWDRWIQNFRIVFNTDLFRELRGHAIHRPSGQSLMVFSVDSNGRLRGKVARTNANYNFNHSLLNSTRRLDHTACLRFPKDSKIKGFNFTMGWDYGVTQPMTREEVIAELRRTNATVARPGTLSATAGQLNSANVSSQVSTNDVNGSLANKGTSGSLTAGQANGPGAASPGAGLPSFNTSVSGLLLPKPKPQELDAKQGEMPEGKKPAEQSDGKK